MTIGRIFLAGYRPALLIAILAQALLHRYQLISVAASERSSAGFWDVLISTQSDQYLFAYTIVPLWLIYTALTVGGYANHQMMLRFGSRTRWLLFNVRNGASEAAVIVVLVVLAGAVVGIALPLSWPSAISPSLQGPLSAFSSSGTPLFAIIVGQAALTWLVLLSLHVVFAGLRVFSASPGVAIGVLASIYVFVLLSSRTALGGFPTNGLYFLYEHTTVFGVCVAFLLPLGLSAAVVMLVYSAEHRRKPHIRPLQIRQILPWGCYAAIVTFGLASTVSARSNDSLTLGSGLQATFYGGGPQGFEFGAYVYFCFVFLGFAFLLVSKVDAEFSPRIHLLAIRNGSLVPWITRILLKAFVSITVMVLLLVGGTVVAVSLVRGSPPALGDSYAVGTFVSMSILQTYFTSIAAILILVLTRSPPLVLLFFALNIIFGLPSINTERILPMGLNAMGGLFIVPSHGFGSLGVILIAFVVVSITALGLAALPASQRAIAERK